MKKWNNYKFGSDAWIESIQFKKDFEGKFVPILETHFFDYHIAIRKAVINDLTFLIFYKIGRIHDKN